MGPEFDMIGGGGGRGSSKEVNVLFGGLGVTGGEGAKLDAGGGKNESVGGAGGKLVETAEKIIKLPINVFQIKKLYEFLIL